MPAPNDAPMKPLVYCTRSIIAWQQGAKTQTRRLVRPQPKSEQTLWQDRTGVWWWYEPYQLAGYRLSRIRQPYAVGDLLWIREALVRFYGWVAYDADQVYADGAPVDPHHHVLVRWPSKRWKRHKLPAMFMPRWACRHYARVVNVRPGWLQDINDEDAVAEGVLVYWHNLSARSTWYQGKSQSLYLEWWDDLHKKPGTRSEDNPWVWIYGLEAADAS